MLESYFSCPKMLRCQWESKKLNTGVPLRTINVDHDDVLGRRNLLEQYLLDSNVRHGITERKTCLTTRFKSILNIFNALFDSSQKLQSIDTYYGYESL